MNFKGKITSVKKLFIPDLVYRCVLYYSLTFSVYLCHFNASKTEFLHPRFLNVYHSVFNKFSVTFLNR